MEYKLTLTVSPEELALFSPLADAGVPAKTSLWDLDDAFEELGKVVSWTYGPDSSAPFYDRFFTFKFDDDHIFDVSWTYDDGGDEDRHWYFNGVQYGTRDNVICEYGECILDEPVACLESEPEGSVTGEYKYQVGSDTYVLVLEEASI